MYQYLPTANLKATTDLMFGAMQMISDISLRDPLLEQVS